MKLQKNKKLIIVAVIAVLLTALIIWTLWGNTALMVNKITVEGENIPEGFDGFRIAHISDLHNTEFGKNNIKLIKMLRDTEPDIIVITGDLIDAKRTNIKVAVDFAKQADAIAPTYYVTGNHEANITNYETLKNGLTEVGVVILDNRSIRLENNGEHIILAGINDPFFPGSFEENLKNLTADQDSYIVLLSHRPELFDDYVKYEADLVFAGHAHGGQFRLPFVGGIVAPGQGLFPKYDGGKYIKGDTAMIVSRGIGNSIIPLRFNNRPEIIVAELKSI